MTPVSFFPKISYSRKPSEEAKMRKKKLLLLSALFTASAAVISCGGGGGGGGSSSSSNQTQTTQQQPTQQQKVATVEGSVPQDIQLAPDADTRAITGVKDVVALLKNGETVDGYFTNGGKNFVVQGIPVGQEAAIAFIDRKVTQGQDVPEDAKILAATPFIKVENTQVKVDITQVNPDGTCEVKVQGGEPTNEVPPTGVTLAEAEQQLQQQQQQQVAQQANQTQGTFFGQAEQGWLTKKVVGPYQIIKYLRLQTNNVDYTLVNAAINNRSLITQIENATYVFTNDPNNNFAVLKLQTDGKISLVKITDKSPSNNQLGTYQNAYRLPGTNLVLVWNAQGATNQLHLLQITENGATAYYVGDPAQVAANTNTHENILGVDENNGKYYIFVLDGTADALAGTLANLRTIVFDSQQGTVNVINYPKQLAYARVVDAKTVWGVALDGETPPNARFYLVKWDPTSEAWIEQAESAPIARNNNNALFDVTNYIDANGDNNADTFNLYDSATPAWTGRVDFLSASANTVKAVITFTDATLNGNATDVVSFIADLKALGQNIALSKFAPIAWDVDGTNITSLQEVAKADIDTSNFYLILQDNAAQQYVEKLEETTNGYTIINTSGLIDFSPATESANLQITNAALLPAAFNGAVYSGAGKNANLTVSENKNLVLASWTGNAAAIVTIFNGALQNPIALNPANVDNLAAINRVDVIPGKDAVVVADDTDNQVSIVKWNTQGWYVDSEVDYPNGYTTATNLIRTVGEGKFVAQDARTNFYLVTQNSKGELAFAPDTIAQPGTTEWGNPAMDFLYWTKDGVTVNPPGTATTIDYVYMNPTPEQWSIDGLLTANRIMNAVNNSFVLHEGNNVYIGINGADSSGNNMASVVILSREDTTDAYIASSMFTNQENNQKNIVEVEVSGAAKVAFVRDNQSYIYAIDVSNPAEPKLLGEGLIGFTPVDSAISTDGKYLYVVGSDIVAKVNTTGNIEKSVEQQITITEGQSTHTLNVLLDGVTYAGDYIIIAGHVDYTLSGSTVSKAVIRILKSDDLSPVSDWITVATNSGANNLARINRIFAVGKYVYMEVLTGTDVDGNNQLIQGIDNIATDDLITVAVDNPASPKKVSALTGIRNLVVTGSGRAYAFDPNNLNVVKVISLANPANPAITAVVDISDLGTGITGMLQAYGNYVFLTDGQNRIEIIDLTDPKAPQYVGDITFPNHTRIAGNITINNFSINSIDAKSYLSVGTNNGFYIFDLNPLNLK